MLENNAKQVENTQALIIYSAKQLLTLTKSWVTRVLPRAKNMQTATNIDPCQPAQADMGQYFCKFRRSSFHTAWLNHL